MNALNFIKFLERSEKSVFITNDVSKVIGKNKKYTALFLERMFKKGLVLRIEKNKYALPYINAYSIASNLVYPSYVSFLSGIRYYNLTTQLPQYILVAAKKQKKTIDFENYKIQFIKLEKKKFFGYKRERVDNKYVFVAELEKLILDCLYLPKNCPISDTFEALKECKNQIEVGKLVNYGIRMDSNIVLKRLGFLLEILGIDIYEQISSYINRKYENLSPYHPRRGKKNKKWKLVENIFLYD